MIFDEPNIVFAMLGVYMAIGTAGLLVVLIVYLFWLLRPWPFRFQQDRKR